MKKPQAPTYKLPFNMPLLVWLLIIAMIVTFSYALGRVSEGGTIGGDGHEHHHEAVTEMRHEQSSVFSGTTIVVTDKGFDKRSYQAKQNTYVTVRNDSSKPLEFSSGEEGKSHTNEPEFNLKTLRPGETGNFTPLNTGTFPFHDHINESHQSSLVVTQ